MRVAVLDDYQGVALECADWGRLHPRATVHAFREHFDSEDDLVANLGDFDAVVLMRERTPLSASTIARLPRLRLIVTAATRNASLDVEAAHAAGIAVCGTRALVAPTVELTWALILGLSRNIAREDANVRAGGWQLMVGDMLEGRTLGLLGLGMLGERVARIGKAFGMPVIAWSPNLTSERAAPLGVEAVSADELFQRSDVLTIHLRLSETSQHIVDASRLRMMKREAILINTSRSRLVREDDLVTALRERWILGAALDVFDIEPLPAGHPFMSLPNVLLSPHMGFVTRQNYELFFGDALEDIESYLDGKLLRPLEVGMYNNARRAPLPRISDSMVGLG